jgi:DNA-binding NarL/FixJ family response regulator
MENVCLQETVVSTNITQRECDILHLLAEGYTNTQMAEKLHISIRTVEWHRANLILKLKLGTASQLIIAAVEYARSKKG